MTRPPPIRHTDRILVLSAAALTALAPAPGASGQSVLDRTPNLSGSWVGSPGTLYFNFLHRFDATDAPTRKVTNSPTFLLGYGVGGYGFLGVHYATSSNLVANHPNEWELLGRLSPLSSAVGAPVDLGLTAAYNEAAESVDGELSLGVPVGPANLMGSARFFSNAFGEDESRWALGAGARLSLHPNVALAADIVSLTDEKEDEEYGWSAGVQVDIPYTPHTVSIHAANTNSATLQGSSRRSSGTRFGFEFTVPVTLSRFFGGGGPSGAQTRRRTGEADLVAADTVRIPIRDFEFDRERIVVRPGTYVLWVNDGDVPHSTTADGGAWDSRLLAPGESYGRVFTDTGEYPYHCQPHPFMTAVVVVEAGARAPNVGGTRGGRR